MSYMLLGAMSKPIMIFIMLYLLHMICQQKAAAFLYQYQDKVNKVSKGVYQRQWCWEKFIIENLLSNALYGTRASFYRTAAGDEIDLILELPGGRKWAIEIKTGLAPKL